MLHTSRTSNHPTCHLKGERSMLSHTCEILLLSVHDMTAIAQCSTLPQAVKSQKQSYVYHATNMKAYLVYSKSASNSATPLWSNFFVNPST